MFQFSKRIQIQLKSRTVVHSPSPGLRAYSSFFIKRKQCQENFGDIFCVRYI